MERPSDNQEVWVPVDRTKGIWEIAATKQEGSRVRVYHSYLRDWSPMVATTCDALGIDRPEMKREKKDKFWLEFKDSQDAFTFVEFTKRNENT